MFRNNQMSNQTMNEEPTHSNSQGCHSENITTVETGDLDAPLLPILKIPNSFRKQMNSKTDNIIVEDHSNFRVIFYVEKEFLYEASIFYPHYLIAYKEFLKGYLKTINPLLFPQKDILKPYSCLETIIYLNNLKLQEQYENQKYLHLNSGYLNSDSRVRELFLFYGNSSCLVNKAASEGFSAVNFLSSEKGSLFGSGIYFSTSPQISLNHGPCLLLCKILVGIAETHIFNLAPTKPLEKMSDSCDTRIISFGNINVLHIVKNPIQILPYAIIHLKSDYVRKMDCQLIFNRHYELCYQDSSNI